MFRGGLIRLFPLLLLLLLTQSPCPAEVRKILIIGNSYTYVNGLNTLLEQIISSTGDTVQVSRSAQSGFNLNDHWFDDATQQMLDCRAWDLVILQEQSLIPTTASLREYEMVPAVQRFYDKVTARGGQVMLLMTWGRRDGVDATELGQRVHFDSYGAMQEALRVGYEAVGTEFQIPVAPAGLAWQACRNLYPAIELYQSDGAHPSLNGSYLAALALYSEIFGGSMAAVGFHPAGISDQTAAQLKDAVSRVFPRSLRLTAARCVANSRIQLSVLADGLDAARSWGFSLDYDSSRLQLTGIGQGVDTESWEAVTQETVAGRTRILGHASNTVVPLSGSGRELCTLTFQVRDFGLQPLLVRPLFLLDGVAHSLTQAGEINQLAVRPENWLGY